MSNRLQNDEDCIAVWRSFISRFNNLIAVEPPLAKAKEELLKIKAEASIKNALNYRQTDAIIARVDNYLAGEFGNTKRPEHYNQGKSQSKQ